MSTTSTETCGTGRERETVDPGMMLYLVVLMIIAGCDREG
jgi:hypothetical protein